MLVLVLVLEPVVGRPVVVLVRRLELVLVEPVLVRRLVLIAVLIHPGPAGQ